MTSRDWKIKRLDEFMEAIAEAKLLAEEFKVLSTEFEAIADELVQGGAFAPCNSTAKAIEVRSLLAKRNKLAKTMSEACKELAPDLKRAGILP